MSGHIAGALERAVVEGKMDSQNRQWRLVRRPEGLLRVEDVELRPGDEDRRPLQPGQVRVRNLLFLYAPTMRNWMSARSDSLHEIIPPGSPVKTLAAGRIVERSEEHPSELQSLMRISYAVFCLKKTTQLDNM